MSRIVLVRHGETVWHAENRYAGSTDIELSARGHEQARALALWAKHARFARLYVSPIVRARLTAQPVAEALGQTPTVDRRLREIDFGVGEGLTAQEIQARFPEQHAAFLKDPVAHFLQGGEDPLAVIARGREALSRIAGETGAQERVLVVTHNSVIRLLLCDLLGIAPAKYRDVFPALQNVSVTEILLAERGAALLCLNVPIAEAFS